MAETTEFGGVVEEETADEELGAKSAPGPTGCDDGLREKENSESFLVR